MIRKGGLVVVVKVRMRGKRRKAKLEKDSTEEASQPDGDKEYLN